MKKTLLIMICCAMCASGFSQKIKISGSLDFLKNVKSFNLQFTYENMTVGKMTEKDYVAKKVNGYNEKEAGRGEVWHKAWIGDREQRFEPKFVELFNKHTAKAFIEISSEPEYTMILNTDFSEPGFNVGVMRKNAALNLTAKFVDKDNKELAVITIVNASANNFWGTDFDTGYRLQESYAVAGRELAKFINKKLK